MTPDEILWRLWSEGRNRIDRLRFAARLLPSPGRSVAEGISRAPGFRVTNIDPGEWKRPGLDPRVGSWADRLARRADEIVAGRMSFFQLKGAFLGDPVDWNRDHEGDIAAPLGYAQTIDYRDYRVTGDAKLVWEPNRHHHLVVLGRAYRAFGEERYAAAAARHLESWLDQCPFGYGMNWRSPLELAIRLINWVWALDLLRGCASLDGRLGARIARSIQLHVWEISRKYSHGSSANNHIIGEAAGVFVATSWCPQLSGARRRRAQSREILVREIARQTYGDGCTREQAIGYHLFVLQFLVVAGLAARTCGEDFPRPYWDRVEKMMEFAAAMAEGGPVPFFGDCDDGIVLDLAGGGADLPGLLSLGAALFGRPDLKPAAGGPGESAYWMYGRGALERFDSLPPAPAAGRLRSKGYPESGYYLLQRGGSASAERVSVLFDCAELGYLSIAAHGHADALSFVYRLAGRDVFIDPGTFDYFTYPEWRTYFRSTAAHNTLEIDGRNQSEMLGAFLWGERANARCTRFEPRGEGGIVAGEHDGYSRLGAPAVHSRTVEMDGDTGVVSLTDTVRSRGSHDVRIFFHVAEGCGVHMVGDSRIRIETGGQVVHLETDPALALTLVSGGEAPIAGWASRGYHHKCVATTIIAAARTEGDASFRFSIRPEWAPSGPEGSGGPA